MGTLYNHKAKAGKVSERDKERIGPVPSLAIAERVGFASCHIPCLNAAPLWSFLRRWKRQEDRSNKEYGLKLQRNKITIIGVLCNGSTYQNELLQRRATGRNAIWERPTMSRRDDGGVAVSTAMESQRKGSTPPGIDCGCEKVNGRFFAFLLIC